MEERELWYWLLSLETIGPAAIKRMLEQCGAPEAIFHTEALPLRAKQAEELRESRRNFASLQREYEAMEAGGIRMVLLTDTEYPSRLKSIYGRPYGIFVKGLLPPEHLPAAAVVGARRCSHYGRETAQAIGRELAWRGIPVISGMALGIDGFSQRSALEAGGSSYAVLGCGADICYPSSHRELYALLARRGGILSEYTPGKMAAPHRFPMRNRIISGLADLVIVVEAREKSGSLITADQALEQGREVMAVPGRVGDSLSLGCNQLIRQGAGIMTSLQDVFLALGIAEETSEKGKSMPALSPEEAEIYACLEMTPKHLEELSQETGWSISALMMYLLQLELKGFIRQEGGNQYSRRL